MHPVYHVLISVLIIIGVGLHVKRKWITAAVMALGVNAFIDFDYILMDQGFFRMRIFHTAIVMVYAPLILLLICYLYEKNKETSVMTRISLVIVLVSSSHLLMDTFFPEDTVYLYYPLNTDVYHMNPSLVPYVIIVFFFLVLGMNLLETRIYLMNEGKKKYGVPSDISKMIHDYKRRLKTVLRKKP